VSVVVRDQPDLIGKPVAVCHSDSVQGTGEISSANYPARSYGRFNLSLCLYIQMIYEAVFLCCGLSRNAYRLNLKIFQDFPVLV
jgi:nucleotidyltransferase/DNA polymerase involved in DNA repair